MRTLLVKKTFWMYTAIGMVLLSGMFVNNACGYGPPTCSDPCKKWGFDGHSWECIDKCYPQACCDGECYDAKCMYCNDTTIQPICDPNLCQTCDGNNNCVSSCSSADCEFCDGAGHCKVCGGDPNFICSDGHCCLSGSSWTWCAEGGWGCRWPCHTGIPDTESCSEENEADSKCNGCVQVGPEPACGTYLDYTGVQRTQCYDGCPENRNDTEPVCYAIKECIPMIHSNHVCVDCEGTQACAPIVEFGPPAPGCKSILGKCAVNVSCYIIKLCWQCESGGPTVWKNPTETCDCK